MKYFTMDEMCRSNTALLHHIPNYPQSEEIFDNLHALADNILDPARERLGRPIYVNSGYRCPKVNELVGGSKTSAHMRGCAADIWCNNMTELYNILRQLPVFDQLISYKGKNFYHISYDPERGNRHQILHL